MKKLIIIFLLLVLFIPAITKAAGLVPCGGPEPEKPCTACDLLVLAENVLHYALTLAFTIVVIFAIIAGFRLIFSGGNEVNIKAAQKSLSTALIGLAIILCSYLIVNTVFWLMAQIGGDDYTSDWWHLECTYPESKTDNDGDNGNGGGDGGGNGGDGGGNIYEYGDACRLQTVPPYNCHKEENCCYQSEDCDFPGSNKGQFDCPDGWVCCVAKTGVTDPPMPTPPPPNPGGPCEGGQLLKLCPNYSVCLSHQCPNQPIQIWCSKGAVMRCPEACIHECDCDEVCKGAEKCP